jgi:hypothetical protein
MNLSVRTSTRPYGGCLIEMVERIDTGMTHEPGIYFGMPEDEYHSIPAVSASGIKRIAITSMDFLGRMCR